MNSFSYAQDLCNSCSSTPKNLEEYFTMMDKLITHMSTFEGKKPVESEETEIPLEGKPDPLTGVIQAAEDIKMEVEQERQVTSQILINELTVDPFREMKLMESGEARKRDRDRFKEKDTKIREGIQKMLKAGYVGVPVPNSILTKVDNELKKLKYFELGKVGDDFIMLKSGAKYEELAKMLWQINALYKELHVKAWYHTQLKDINKGNLQANLQDAEESLKQPRIELLNIVRKDLDKVTDKYLLVLSGNKSGKSFEWINFKNNKRDFLAVIWQIQSDYACAYGVKNQCEATGRAKVAKDSWAQVKDVYQNDGGAAINTFKVAFSRLKGALFLGNKADKAAAQQRENQLLNSIYGRDIPEYKKRWKNEQIDKEGNVVATPLNGTSLKSYLVRRMKTSLIDIVVSGDDTPRWLIAGYEAIKKEIKNESISEGKDATVEEKKTFLNEIKDYIEESSKHSRTTESFDNRSFLQQSASKREVTSFRSTFESMKAFQKEFEKKSVLVDPLEFTKQFPKLSQSVYTNAAYIGDKEAKDMMYHSMGNVCEIQCGDNLQGSCWYDTN